MILRMIPNAKLEGEVKLHRTTSRRLRTGRRDRPRGEVWLEKQGICAANIVYTSSVMAHVIGKCIGGIVRTSITYFRGAVGATATDRVYRVGKAGMYPLKAEATLR